jgi:hypothetical protein
MMSPDQSRRLFLLGSAALLGGCATSQPSSSGLLPGLVWGPNPEQATPGTPSSTGAGSPTGVIARTRWAKGSPIPSRMNRMRPVHRITVHHDGMSSFTAMSFNDSAMRLESIRRAHLRRTPEPFGDIGYHFAVDPAGRVWQCRPLTWQGAHVRRQNSGNLGIVMLGNYDKQAVNTKQQAALMKFIRSAMKQYKVPATKVATHQELAATACPGRSLQAFMLRARRSGLT